MLKALETKDNNLFRGDFMPPVELDIKSVTEEGEFEGYGSIFSTTDQGGDMVIPGAFKDSLSRIPAAKVRMLFKHDPSQPIGHYLEMYEDTTGLFVRGKLSLGVGRAKEIHELMKDGAIEGMSIGYRTVRAERDEKTGQRKLLELELWEVSIVTFPMHTSANVRLVKQDGSLPSEREFEQMLARDAGFSARQAKAITAEGYKSLLNSERDAGGNGGEDAELAALLNQAAGSFTA